MRPFAAFFILVFMLAGCGDGGTAPEDGGDDGDNGGTPEAKPAVLPDFATVGLYSDNSPWNQAIRDAQEVDANSAELVANLAEANTFVIQVRQYSSPVYFADAGTPRVDVTLECAASWEMGVTMLHDVPVPGFAEPAFDADGADNPPVGCGEESDQDNHMVILDLANRKAPTSR